MAFDPQAFYPALDAVYASGDNAAVEAFLLEQLRLARLDGGNLPNNEGCPSCLPEITVNAGLVSVCNELGCFYRGLSRWKEALAAFDEAQEEMERLYAADTAQYGVMLLNKAGVYRYMGDMDRAMETFGRARTVLERHPETPGATMAGLYNNIGLVHLDRAEPGDAEALFELAMSCLGDPGEHLTEFATTCSNLAVAHAQQNRYEEAVRDMEMAVTVLSAMDDGHNAHYPAVLNTRGMLLYRSGRPEEALADFILAAGKTALIYGENVEYANACGNCAACCQKLGREEEAAAWLDKEKTVLRRLRA